MRIASITAGAAGMFCGSCMKDNTLATALIDLGHDTLLLPTYTPITTDEPSIATPRIFFGGVNVFLEQSRWTRWLFRRTPRFIDALFNGKRLLRYVGRWAGKTDYSTLGVQPLRSHLSEIAAFVKRTTPDAAPFDVAQRTDIAPLKAAVDALKARAD